MPRNNSASSIRPALNKLPMTDAEQELHDLLVGTLPPIIAREDVEKLLGGSISRNSMARADSDGVGPDKAFCLGRKVIYRTDTLVPWIISRYGVKYRSPKL